ncbi:hypothetical protein GCM10017786_58150 [Amycolatopsis deserti]|uniref:DUF397 domain-containing protein n=1 Tax=Amycolatopsis deserti TaxID=185696 RepID=A0ABQ3JCS2_9PSEU|nr:hypothetical protein GCM10017786_58150 [Amycolatopsis deserti]
MLSRRARNSTRSASLCVELTVSPWQLRRGGTKLIHRSGRERYDQFNAEPLNGGNEQRFRTGGET